MLKICRKFPFDNDMKSSKKKMYFYEKLENKSRDMLRY